MKVTAVKVNRFTDEASRIKGIASILLDDSLIVNNIRIIHGDNGLFIAMPSRKVESGHYRDVVQPVNPDVMEMFQDSILDVYAKSDEMDGQFVSIEPKDLDASNKVHL